MTNLMLMPEEDVFVPGSDAPELYLVVNGQMTYTQTPESSHVHKSVSVLANEGAWICEAALWSRWVHVGVLEAPETNAAELISFQVEGMHKILMKHHVVRTICNDYSKQFHSRLIEAMPPYGSWPNDLHVDFTDFGDVVVSMAQGARMLIGQVTLQQQSKVSPWHHRRMALLQDEVSQGRSTIVPKGKGGIERIVLVVCLWLKNSS